MNREIAAAVPAALLETKATKFVAYPIRTRTY
jgi:hypothetical protein